VPLSSSRGSYPTPYAAACHTEHGDGILHRSRGEDVVRPFRTSSTSDRYSAAYRSEARRLLDLWTAQGGARDDVAHVAIVHKRALSEASRRIDPHARLRMHPDGLRLLESFQLAELTALLAATGVEVAAYNAHVRTEQDREQRLRAWRERQES
jgi:hypothetical protein